MKKKSILLVLLAIVASVSTFSSLNVAEAQTAAELREIQAELNAKAEKVKRMCTRWVRLKTISELARTRLLEIEEPRPIDRMRINSYDYWIGKYGMYSQECSKLETALRNGATAAGSGDMDGLRDSIRKARGLTGEVGGFFRDIFDFIGPLGPIWSLFSATSAGPVLAQQAISPVPISLTTAGVATVTDPILAEVVDAIREVSVQLRDWGYDDEFTDADEEYLLKLAEAIRVVCTSALHRTGLCM